MTRLPSFVNNPQINPGPLIDSPNIYEGYSKMFGEVEAATRPIAHSLADARAKQEGEQAGQDLNFKPVLPIGEASKVYNDTAITANKYTSGS